jgi:ribulose-phosphate 3-epimerase
MVNHPIAELKKWQTVKNIERVIFHFECQDDIAEIIDTIKSAGYEVGLAINPETDPISIHPYLKDINELLFLTVHPGQQGAPFVKAVEKNIKKINRILSQRNFRPQIAVDGAIKLDNIQLVKSWGVDNFCVGSAITTASDPQNAFNELNKLI